MLKVLAISYDPFVMSSTFTPIDISNVPELADLVEEVEATKKPRELKRDNKVVAVISPVLKNERMHPNQMLSMENPLLLLGVGVIWTLTNW